MPKKSAVERSTNHKHGTTVNQPQRLQRLLASAGFGSRRQCEELIAAGRVAIDGQVVSKLGSTVDPQVNKVHVDGVLLHKQKLVHYAVNKPIGFVTTNRDPQGRPRVVDLVPPDERVFAVGRLDRNSEGLMLLTNDGELAQRLTHPKFGVRKVYRVTVAGKVDGETMKQMRKGIHIAEGFVKVEGAKLLKSRSRSTELEIVLREGKNREIRRILARLGHKVQQLRRIAVGPLRLGDVPAGAYRILSREEVKKLWAATEQPHQEPPPKTAAKPRKTAGRKTAGQKTAGQKTANRRPVKQAKPKFNLSTVAPRSGSVIGGDEPPPKKSGSTSRAAKSRAGKQRASKKSKR
jgi:23S rRNA pseudouridine2605 synthase